MTDVTPTVSVCIPVYNRQAMLRAALWSVLGQTFRDFEVIVSDNASQDDIETEVMGLNDPRLRYIRQDKNIGGAENFFFLQTVARGKYLLFLGSDDLLLPECLAKAVAAVEAQPQRGAVIYMAAHYGSEGFRYLSTMPDRDHAAAEEYAADKAVRDFNYMSPTFCLYRRAAFEQLKGWNRKFLAIIDWDMYARMVRDGGGVIFLREVLAIMRLHDKRMSNSSALHWGFYHDAMLLAAEPDNKWPYAGRANFIIEQLMWDFRLKRSPWRTLSHAYKTGAFPVALLWLPGEIAQRVLRKLRAGRVPHGLPTAAESLGDFDCLALDRFWNESEKVRLRS